MTKYALEFVLCVKDISEQEIKASLAEFTESLAVSACEGEPQETQEFKLVMRVEDPTLIFDTCGQWGKIRAVKVSEIER